MKRNVFTPKGLQLWKKLVVLTLEIISKVLHLPFILFIRSCCNFLGREFNSIIKAATGLSSEQQKAVRSQVSTEVVFWVGSRKG